MEFLDYQLDVPEEQKQIQVTARKFALEVLRPAGKALDKMAPEVVCARNSLLFDVLNKAHELGFTRLGGPVEMGGMGASLETQRMVLEELSYGSVGLASVILLSAFPPEAALASGNPELIEEIARPHFAGKPIKVGAWAITEPDHGSDMLGASHDSLRGKGPMQVVARLDGDSWVLNGQKSSWVSNGPIAEQAVLFCQIESGTNLAQGGVFVLPLNLPGISKGKALDKHGVRSLPQGEIFFDDVRVPRRYNVVTPDNYKNYLDTTLTAFNASVGVVCAGFARAVFEETLNYTRSRVQGGRSIYEHQSVRARLFKMFSLMQAMQSLSRNVYVHNQAAMAQGRTGLLHHSIASKVFCSDSAYEVAKLGFQLHGGNGMTKEYIVELFLRDAAAFTIADGENAFLSLIGAGML